MHQIWKYTISRGPGSSLGSPCCCNCHYYFSAHWQKNRSSRTLYLSAGSSCLAILVTSNRQVFPSCIQLPAQKLKIWGSHEPVCNSTWADDRVSLTMLLLLFSAQMTTLAFSSSLILRADFANPPDGGYKSPLCCD